MTPEHIFYCTVHGARQMDDPNLVDRCVVMDQVIAFIRQLREQRELEPDCVFTDAVIGSTVTEPVPPVTKEGLYGKFLVYPAEAADQFDEYHPYDDAFVLRPSVDTAARAALAMYADSTDNVTLSRDLFRWLVTLPPPGPGPVPRYPAAKR